MEEKKQIVIAEDYTILREGLRALLSSASDLEVIGEAEDGRSAVRCVSDLEPDLVLMDLSMPKMSGIDAIREIKKSFPHTKVIALTVHEKEEYILASLQAGADGYVLKDATRAELMTAIRTVLDGKRFLSPGVSEKVIEGYLEGKRAGEPKSIWETITPREREILKLVAEGYKNKEIADQLCISVKTVDKHRTNLMRKLDLHTVSALTAFAIEKGLVAKSNITS
jgi:two-component system response regulator NreC